MAHATVRVQFGNQGDAASQAGHLSAEIDGRPEGLNGGKTSFAPGEPVHILVYKSSNVRITETACSAGSLAAGGVATVSVTEDVMFDGENTATLIKPASAGSVQATWMGRNLGGLSLQSDRMTVKAASKGVAVARVTYATQAQVYTLSSPSSLNGETDFSVLAIIKGAAA